MAKYKNIINPLVLALKALGDDSRLRAFNALRGGELCVCQITELLQLAPSTVSKHMSILKQAGLLESRKQGRWIYYKLATPSKDLPLEQLTYAVQAIMQSDKKGNTDLKTIKKILKCNPEELCQKQCRN